jgi:hypothetical protein
MSSLFSRTKDEADSQHNARLGKLLMIVAPVGVAVAVGTQLLVVIIHFAFKVSNHYAADGRILIMIERCN